MKIQMKKPAVVICFIMVCFSLLPASRAQAQLFGNTNVPVYDEKTQTALISSSDLDVGSFGNILGSIGSFFGADIGSTINKIAGAVNTALNVAHLVMNDIQTTKCMKLEFMNGLTNLKNTTYWQNQVGLAILSNPKDESKVIGDALAGLNQQQVCVESQINNLRSIKPATIAEGQRKQSLIDDLTKIKLANDTRRDQLSQQLRSAQRGFYATQMVKMFKNLSKTITANLVQNTNQQYKIGNYQNYLQSLSDQVYTRQALQKKSGDNMDKSIMYNLLHKPASQNKVQPAVAMKASKGLTPASQVDVHSQNFTDQMMQQGVAEHQPAFLQALYVSNAEAAQAEGSQAAAQEIASGNGYKGPRKCAAQDTQPQTDAAYQALSDEFENRNALLRQLQDAQINGQPVDSGDLQRAQADVSDVQARLDAWSSGQAETVSIQCPELIAPPINASQVVNAGVGVSANNLTNYNENDLLGYPDYMNQAGQDLFNDVLGRTDYSSGSGNGSETGSFTVKKDGVAGQYAVSWNVASVPNADHVTISGPGNFTLSSKNLNDKITVKSPDDSLFKLYVYDAGNKLITTLTYSALPQPVVAGVFTVRNLKPIRGNSATPNLPIRGQ